MTVTPQLGDFGLVATNRGNPLDRLCSWAIRWGTDSPVNHAFIYIGEGTIIEARAHVQYASVTEYSDIIWSTGRLATEPSQEQRGRIAQAAEAAVGLRYNVLDIVAIALAQPRLGHLVDGDEWWVKRLSDGHMYICSQLVDAVYMKAGIDLIPERLDGLVSPGDLLKHLEPAAR